MLYIRYHYAIISLTSFACDVRLFYLFCCLCLSILYCNLTNKERCMKIFIHHNNGSINKTEKQTNITQLGRTHISRSNRMHRLYSFVQI